jgi:beta-glucosidase
MGKAVVRGLQGNDPKYLKTHSCAKHYAVHRFFCVIGPFLILCCNINCCSGPEPTRHTYNAEPTPRDLWTTYLPAFKSLVTEVDVQEVVCFFFL